MRATKTDVLCDVGSTRDRRSAALPVLRLSAAAACVQRRNARSPAARPRLARRAHGPRGGGAGGGAVDATGWVSPGSNTSGQGNGCVPKLIMTGERRQIATEPSCMAASWLSESAFTTEPCCIRIVLVSLSARAAAAAASFDAPAGPDTAAP